MTAGATRAARGASLLLGVLCSACFGYVPAEPGSVAPGEDVRVHVTRAETLPVFVTAGEDPSVDGRLVREDGDQVVLHVPVGVETRPIMTRTIGQDVTIPASRIVQWERRELNRARTAVAAAAGVGMVVAALLSFGDGVPDPELLPKPQPEELGGGRRSISFFSISVP